MGWHLEMELLDEDDNILAKEEVVGTKAQPFRTPDTKNLALFLRRNEAIAWERFTIRVKNND